jgi:hypothetical protein
VLPPAGYKWRGRLPVEQANPATEMTAELQVAVVALTGLLFGLNGEASADRWSLEIRCVRIGQHVGLDPIVIAIKTGALAVYDLHKRLALPARLQRAKDGAGFADASGIKV